MEAKTTGKLETGMVNFEQYGNSRLRNRSGRHTKGPKLGYAPFLVYKKDPRLIFTWTKSVTITPMPWRCAHTTILCRSQPSNVHRNRRGPAPYYSPFTLKLTVGWEIHARRHNQLHLLHHMTPLSARGYWRDRDPVATDEHMTDPTSTSFHRTASLVVNRVKTVWLKVTDCPIFWTIYFVSPHNGLQQTLQSIGANTALCTYHVTIHPSLRSRETPKALN